MIHVRAAAVKNIRSAACIDLSGVRFCNAIEDMRTFLRRHSEFLFHCTKTPHKRHWRELSKRGKSVQKRHSRLDILQPLHKLFLLLVRGIPDILYLLTNCKDAAILYKQSYSKGGIYHAQS